MQDNATITAGFAAKRVKGARYIDKIDRYTMATPEKRPATK